VAENPLALGTNDFCVAEQAGFFEGAIGGVKEDVGEVFFAQDGSIGLTADEPFRVGANFNFNGTGAIEHDVILCPATGWNGSIGSSDR
jgi:hypothetical protein